MELASRIKTYFTFSFEEIRDIVIAIVVIAFIVSFKDLFGEFGFGYKFGSMINSVLLVGVALLVKDGVQKIEALRRGYRCEWRIGLYGLLIALVLVFLSNGLLMILIPGGIVVYMMKGLRLGKFRYGLNRFEVAEIAMLGPMTSIALAVIFKALMMVSASPLLDKAVFINVWLAMFAMVPVPPMDGSRIFFGSRLTYFFTLGCVIGCGLLLYLTTIWIAVLGSLLCGGIVWFVWLTTMEL